MSRLSGLNAYECHKLLVDEYQRYYGGASAAAPPVPGPAKSDKEILREHHRFIREDEDDAEETWAVRFAQKYYERLFKEYALADLSRYRESKIGFRWRTAPEVVSGKGQFSCGVLGCNEYQGLESFEVNFVYLEAGARRQALVKLRCCPSCAYKLNYRAIRRLHRQLKDAAREAREEARKGKGTMEEDKAASGGRRGRERSRSRSRSREGGRKARREEGVSGRDGAGRGGDGPSGSSGRGLEKETLRGATLGAMVASGGGRGGREGGREAGGGGQEEGAEEEEPTKEEAAALLKTLVADGTIKVPRAQAPNDDGEPGAATHGASGDAAGAGAGGTSGTAAGGPAAAGARPRAADFFLTAREEQRWMEELLR